ncbi:aldolase/citrate lyase family protein [Photobacterium sagamiensis]|uniref:aldolase/citrate lyase family protein n=1 Tax=Photobacterium sagamiensis TaxID=2910241 RepID=UPI003D146E42
MFNLMLITNDIDLAKHAVGSGVSRVFVDLETNGKFERQGHLDTLISNHSMQDVRNIRKVISDSELLVRLNPFYEGTQLEIEQAISAGADLIMLPMFKTIDEIKEFSRMIDGRAKFVPLVETAAAAECLTEVVQVKGVSEIYIGLNDLHRDLGLKFMFEPLANGLLESLTATIKKSGLPFGFGGLARIGEGTLPAELILAEHVRLGSSCVILSRTFHRQSESLSDLQSFMNLEDEVNKIVLARESLLKRDLSAQLSDKQHVNDIVLSIISGNA